jgi:hypothetical protein
MHASPDDRLFEPHSPTSGRNERDVRELRIESRGVVRQHPDGGFRPETPKPRHGHGEHRDVSHVQQMVGAGLDEDLHAEALSDFVRSHLSLDRANADQHGKQLVFDVELALGEFLETETRQEPDRR